MNKSWIALLLLGTFGCIGGCMGNVSYRNAALNDAKIAQETRVANGTRAGLVAIPLKPGETPRSKGRFIGVAISGGGLRSANFAAACMFQLQRVGLLEKVDCISSVSGGSLTAAYYCTGALPWNPGDVQKAMTQHFTSDALVQMLMPWNQLALIFSDYDRGDVLAGVFRKEVLNDHGKPLTFADLRNDRPTLLINATNMQTGRRFVFSNEQMDAINTDLSKLDLASAVMASSSVPVVLHQLTLRDFSTTFPQYVHLVDGGIADNLGVVTLVEAFDARRNTAKKAGKPDPFPDGAAIIVIDARTEFDGRLSDKSDTGWIDSLQMGLGLSSTVLLNRASTATLAELLVRFADDNTPTKRLREAIETMRREGWVNVQDSTGRPVQVFHLSLDRVPTDVPGVGNTLGVALNGIGTDFNISTPEAAQLWRAAELIVKYRFEEKLKAVADGKPAPTTQMGFIDVTGEGGWHDNVSLP